jgi:agmatinase
MLAPKSVALVIGSTSAGFARDIIFPPVAAVHANDQAVLSIGRDSFAEFNKFAGLSTYANLPFVQCLAETDVEVAGVEKYDIAILGAPFDTAATARPGARFGPHGIRDGSRRIGAPMSWDVYTGENTFLD